MMSQSPVGIAYDNQYFAPMGLMDFYTDNFYQYMVPLGPRIPNKILQPITGYYFLDSPEFGENQKVVGSIVQNGFIRVRRRRPRKSEACIEAKPLCEAAFHFFATQPFVLARGVFLPKTGLLKLQPKHSAFLFGLRKKFDVGYFPAKGSKKA